MRYFQGLILAMLGLLPGCTSPAQTSIAGAYGGSEFYTSPTGMIRNDKALFFRPDGTYCNQLNEPDWQTRIDGRYTRQGQEITLVSAKDGSVSHAGIRNNGELSYGGATLVKFATMNSLPAQTLEYKMAVSGGGVSGAGRAGGQSRRLLSFDGEGHFSHSAFQGTLISGPAAGGGKVESSEGDGTYTIRNSELTLQYRDGETVRMSFFFSSDEPVIALINGKMYYSPEGKEEKQTGKTESSFLAPSGDERSLPDGESLLEAANRAHGGKYLDALKSLRMIGNMNGMKLVITMDFSGNRMRYEYYQDNRLRGIEQMEGDRGWQIMDGQETDMAADRVRDIQYSLMTGVAGLRSENIKNIRVDRTEKNPKTGGYNVFVNIAGKDYIWMLDDHNRLVAEGSTRDGVEQVELTADFQTVDQIVYPFTIHGYEQGRQTTFTLDQVLINPALADEDWAPPR